MHHLEVVHVVALDGLGKMLLDSLHPKQREK
jgi:hypothetical protein